MNTAAEVSADLSKWLSSGLLKSEVVVKLAEDCLGWPYVFGAAGELCTPANRKKYYNNYINRDPDEAAQIKKRCPVMSETRSSCTGCSYYPGGSTRCYDCRGFTRWVFKQAADITISGAGCTSQWNNSSNWEQKGEIRDMPDVVCCVFMRDKSNPSVMSHTGIHVGGGKIIHCSGTVKAGKTTDKGWTHYAIPKGMDGKVPYPVLRRGSSGEYVKVAQEELQKRGYDIGSTGVDGKFGAKTEAAVKQFQRDWGLEQDGVIGPATWNRLLSAPVIETYSITIKGLTLSEAQALQNKYPGSEINKEMVP